MRRFVLLSCVCLILAGFAGCKHCQKRHLAPVSYLDCEPCGCESALPGPVVGIPGPYPGVLPVPQSGIPGPPVELAPVGRIVKP
jgi:hypothetical protein